MSTRLSSGCSDTATPLITHSFGSSVRAAAKATSEAIFAAAVVAVVAGTVHVAIVAGGSNRSGATGMPTPARASGVAPGCEVEEVRNTITHLDRWGQLVLSRKSTLFRIALRLLALAHALNRSCGYRLTGDHPHF
jgi:hypothetical protein